MEKTMDLHSEWKEMDVPGVFRNKSSIISSVLNKEKEQYHRKNHLPKVASSLIS
jgi:hypothetical protein